MDPSISRSLNDKLYDRRKIGALELERTVRECLEVDDHDKIRAIIDQLRHDFAYSVHMPHARNGGLIGLAAASIALGPEVAPYLEDIIPPVLACFLDQDARVRYYACESMYNIAKVAKGEILPFFNEVFDALCKLSADSELSVKNGAELLDRLIKDIVAESAATYVSVLQSPAGSVAELKTDENDPASSMTESTMPTAFSLEKFIPLLQERIAVLNQFTRIFLVNWLVLLDSIPELELITHLPKFLGGLLKFLNDPNHDVVVATQGALDLFLNEIKRIARIKRGVDFRASQSRTGKTNSDSGSGPLGDAMGENRGSDSNENQEGNDAGTDGYYYPGQDIVVDHEKIIEILIPALEAEEPIQLLALWWIDNFFEICPDELLSFVPRILSHVLPAIADKGQGVRQAAHKVNSTLLNYVVSLPDDTTPPPVPSTPTIGRAPTSLISQTASERRDSFKGRESKESVDLGRGNPPPRPKSRAVPEGPELDYSASVNVLTLQFLNDFEETRVAAMEWLILLHKKAPRKILLMNDGTFPALLKTLNDPSDEVVQRDLQLLSQISHHSDDEYVNSFLHSLLSLFSTDRNLLDKRGNQIIRQLCVDLNPDRVYKTLADILERDEDAEFASIMVQNLNNNLITAPELMDLRKRLRNLETKDGQAFFVSLFKAWCHNAVATFSLCLLAQAYEQASNLLQIFADLDITVSLLIQIDKLVQLLESPVFTYLRLQLLEPEKYPYLYKCLYGLLMLLPQSSAFGMLRNRLNSVSAIGYLHIVPRGATSSQSNISTYERTTRLKNRGEEIKWTELLEKFRSVQEKARKQHAMRSTKSTTTSRPASVLGMPSGGGTRTGTPAPGGLVVRDPPTSGVRPKGGRRLKKL